MIVKQVSVFLENKSGRLNEVTQILGDAGLNLSAFTIADTSDFGILRVIVSEPEKAKDLLKKNDFAVQITEVVLVKTPNQPGGLAKLLNVLNAENRLSVSFQRTLSTIGFFLYTKRHKSPIRSFLQFKNEIVE